MTSKKLGDLSLGGLSLRRPKHEVDERFVSRIYGMAVQLQKQQGGFQSNPLVSVDKRMVQDNMIQVCGRHLEQILMKVLAAKHCLRLRQGRIQQADIAKTLAAAVHCDLLRVRFQHFIERKKGRLHTSLRQLLKGRTVLDVDFLSSRLNLCLSISGRCR